MEKIAELLPGIIAVLIFLMKLSLGFNTRISFLTYFSGRGKLFLRSIFAAMILPVILAIILIKIFTPSILVSAALLLLAAAPGAPLAALKVYKHQGIYSYGISLQIFLVVLSVVTLPLSLGFFNRYFDLELSISWIELSKEIFYVVVFPLAIGMLLGMYKPGWVASFGKKFAKGVNILLLLFSLPLLWAMRSAFFSIGVMEYLMFLLFVLCLFVAGHYLAGKARKERITLAVISSSRHVGICLFVAVRSFERLEFLNILVPYMLVNVILGIIYNKFTPSD